MVEKNHKFPDLNGISLLLIDDDAAIIRSLGRALRGLGAEVTAVRSVREARTYLQEETPDAVLADLMLKDGQGLDLLPIYHTRYPDGLFYLITGYGSVDSAVTAFKHGIRDYFQKPVDPIALAERLASDLGERPAINNLTAALEPYLHFTDPRMVEALLDLPRYAATNQSVLIQGETGTGKELVAHALHALSPRAEGNFVALNCGAIPESMLEAELFGYDKGAFTGAERQHRGRFEQADKGTLFLDEIGEMPLHAQVRLLRVLEDHKVQRLGSERSVPVDVRVIAATHRELTEQIEAGQFRSDIFYRLNVLSIELPPLRQRPADITLLAKHFLSYSLKEMGWTGALPRFSTQALQIMQGHSWPGNVRELRNCMTRLAVRLPSNIKEIETEWLQALLPKLENLHPKDGVWIPAEATLADAEWLLIDAALKRTNYNRSRAAKQLGIGERTLRRKLNSR